MGSCFEPPVQYLRECSDTSLRHYEIIKLEHVANLRRELLVLWDEMLEESSLALLARWMIEHRSSLRSRMRAVEPPRSGPGNASLPAASAVNPFGGDDSADPSVPEDPPAAAAGKLKAGNRR